MLWFITMLDDESKSPERLETHKKFNLLDIAMPISVTKSDHLLSFPLIQVWVYYRAEIW